MSETAVRVTHLLKVVPPYFEALLDGSKTFEVRLNDRAFQRGDWLTLAEWHPRDNRLGSKCECGLWYSRQSDGSSGHYGQQVERVITFVYSGDPRFGGVEDGYVVLALGDPS